MYMIAQEGSACLFKRKLMHYSYADGVSQQNEQFVMPGHECEWLNKEGSLQPLASGETLSYQNKKGDVSHLFMYHSL